MLPVPVSPFASLHPSGATAAPAEATAVIRTPSEAFAAHSAPDTLPAAPPTPDSTGTPFPNPAPLPPAPATSSVPLTFGKAGSVTAPATAHSGQAPAYAIPPGASQPARQKAPPSGKRTPFGLIIFLTLVLGLVLFYRHEQSKKAAAATAPASLPLPASSTTAPAASTPLPKPAAPTPSPTVIPATPPAAPATPPTPNPAAPGSPKIAGAPPATPAAEPVIHGEAIPGVSQDFAPGSPEEQSYQTLEKLLTARKPDEIKAYVHQPAEALRKASSYFPGGDLNPAPWHRIFYDSSTQIPKSAYKARLFRVITDAVPLGFPVAVEETANAPRIDYDAFIQCRNRMLDTFLTTPSAPPDRFLAVMKRAHYFGDQLTDAELQELICLEVSCPNPGANKQPVFIPKNTEFGKMALRRFTWDKSFTPIIELAHTPRYIQLTAIVQDAWRPVTP